MAGQAGGVPVVRLVSTADAPAGLLGEIRALLVAAFDGDDSDHDEGGFSEEDWQHTLGGWHVVVTEDGAVLAHAAVVERDLHVGGRSVRAGYLEGVATRPGRRHEGHGSLAAAEAGRLIGDRFVLGALSTGRHGFYERLGWERWQGPTFVRRGATVVRTEEEDDGIMVLRTGNGRNIDLTATLSCDERNGDDW